MIDNKAITSDLPIPPGEFIVETLEALGLTGSDLAARLGLAPLEMERILSGKKRITKDIARRLAAELGVPEAIIVGLESEYRDALARQGRKPAPSRHHAAPIPRLTFT